MSAIKRILQPIFLKRIVWTLCIVAIMGIDVIRATGNGAEWSIAVNCTGFAVFPLIVLRYKVRDFIKLPYFIWMMISGIMIYPVFNAIRPGTDYDPAYMIFLINVILYGFILIRLYYQFFVECINSGRKTFFLLIWAVMMAGCIVSVNESIWPLCFFVAFGAYYVAPRDMESDEILMKSLVDGLIISFFVIQSHAFLYRPFDTERYCGFYTNSNNTATFYVISYCAILIKLTYLRMSNCKRWIYWIGFALASSLWAFTLLTLGRTAILSMIVVTIIYFIIEEFILFKTKLLGFLKKSGIMLGCFILCIPIVFACVRYIPALRHHPIWFDNELYHEWRVHSWDPIDSEKYTSVEYMLQHLGIRITNSLPNATVDEGMIDLPTSSYETDVNNSGETAKSINVVQSWKEQIIEYSDGIEPGTDEKHPAFIETYYGKWTSILSIRKYVYWYFGSNLNILGHVEQYPQKWITSSFFAYHAHNSFLQFAYCYGIISGVAMVVIAIGIPIYVIGIFVKKREKTPWYYLIPLLFCVAFLVEGITECVVFTGKSLLVLFFLSIFPIVIDSANAYNDV